MKYFARVIKLINDWRIIDSYKSLDADKLFVEMRTKQNELSVWEVSDKADLQASIQKVAHAFAVTQEQPTTFYMIVIPLNELHRIAKTRKHPDGTKTNYTECKQLHYEMEHINLSKLNRFCCKIHKTIKLNNGSLIYCYDFVDEKTDLKRLISNGDIKSKGLHGNISNFLFGA
jgi:hypothetical protein